MNRERFRPTRDNPYALNHEMEFDHVIEITEDGDLVDGPPRVRAPELSWYDDKHHLDARSDQWELMSGYSGQDRYSGPIMHPSEFIGGSMADDILDTPGVYVALVCYDLDDPDDDAEPAGWAVAYIETANMTFVCDGCGKGGTVDDLCSLNGECPDEDCEGTTRLT